jgi:hypothetical protein
VRGANLYESIKTFFIHNLIQIESYDWIDEAMFDECAHRIQATLGDQDYECEKMVHVRQPPSFSLSGFIDILSPRAIYEIKCTRQFTEEHKLQVIVYSYLQAKQNQAASLGDSECLPVFLYSPVTDELLECRPSFPDAERIVQLIVQHKTLTTEPKLPEHIVREAIEARDSRLVSFA